MIEASANDRTTRITVTTWAPSAIEARMLDYFGLAADGMINAR